VDCVALRWRRRSDLALHGRNSDCVLGLPEGCAGPEKRRRSVAGPLGSGNPSYNVGALAICFNYPLFEGTGGIEFWLLNMAVLCAAQNAERGFLRAKPA
jgi:hypothetical protein